MVFMPILSAKKRKILKHVSTLARYCFFDNYAAAEKLFTESFKDFDIDDDWGAGVILAIKGMINAGREGDPSSFYWRCKNASLGDLKNFKNELEKDLSRDNINNFEYGFINAWIAIIDEFINISKERLKK